MKQVNVQRKIPSDYFKKIFFVFSVLILAFGVAVAGKISNNKSPAGKTSQSQFKKSDSLSDGDLDPTFGSGGKVTADFGSFGQVRDVVIQSNGKIVAGGFNSSGMFAMRFKTNGTIDSSYGTNGIASAGINQSYKTLIQSDNKVILVGYDGSNVPTAARLDTTGALDASFGTNGVAILSALGGGYCYGAALQSDGKILLTSRSYNGSNYDVMIARLNTNGTLDTGFNSSGYISVDFGNWEDSYGVAQQSDGKIIFSGASTNIGNDFRYLAIGRLKSDGTLDSTGFGTNGKVLTLYGASVSVGPWNIYEQSDSKIVVSGYSDSKFLLSRYDASGNLDTGFNGTGKATIDFGYTAYGYSVAFQTDGKILIGGGSENGVDADFALARVKTNGIIDSTFGINGKVTTDFGGSNYAYSVKVQQDGKVVLAGYTGSQTAALVRYYVQEVVPTVPSVTEISPASNENSVVTDQAITITFSEAMNAATLTTGTIRVTGSKSGSYSGVVSYDAGTKTATFTPSMDFLVGEKVSVTVTTGVESASAVALEDSYTWSFTIKTAPATASLVQNNLQVGGAINSGPNGVNVSDVDRDGDLDLVWNYGRFMVSIRNGSVYDPVVVYNGATAKQSVTIDLNNDGYPDLAGLTQKNSTDSLVVFFNDGDGTFTFNNRYSVNADTYYGYFTAGDINGDGFADLISTHNYSNKIIVLTNNGNGTFGSGVEYAANGRPRGIALGDVDGDGANDIVITNDVGAIDSISVLINSGNGTFAAPVQYSLEGDHTPVSLVTADVDNDGDLDILVAEYSGNVAVLINNGTGTFAAPVHYNTNYGRLFVVAVDLNGDGYLDIASSGGNVYIQLLNTGDGTFSTATGGNIATASGGLDAGDLNGDGAIDIAYNDNGSWYAKLMMNEVITVPVELSSFSGKPVGSTIELFWRTTTELNNYGFEVESKTDELTWKTLGFVEGKGTTTTPQSYQFIVSGVSGNKNEFRLKQIDRDGTVAYSQILTVDQKPAEFALEQNYPNPFNPSTTIRYSLAAESRVSLKVYNSVGQQVKTLVQASQPAGFYSVPLSASDLSSGVYFYILEAGSFKSVKKLMLVK
ncbi:MAG: FG-GAP-like repeat-containing protein [Bacteroidetes bacterium]|nr:FG-GAP-like repeat-containing protein [Bacteroidota bacterium]